MDYLSTTQTHTQTHEIIHHATSNFVDIIAKAIADKVANQLANQVAPFLKTQTSAPLDKLLNIDGACEMLHLEKPTVYSKVSRGELPYMKKGKRLYFEKEALLEYIKSGKVKTNEELQENALDYLNIRKGGAKNGR